jgi:vancomycin resistance protein YoaR
MKGVMLAVTLLAISSPAFAVITQGQALQEVARCIYHSARTNGLYVSRSHALYLAKESQNILAIIGMEPVRVSPRQQIAADCANEVDTQIVQERQDRAVKKQAEFKANHPKQYARLIAERKARNAMNKKIKEEHDAAIKYAENAQALKDKVEQKKVNPQAKRGTVDQARGIRRIIGILR